LGSSYGEVTSADKTRHEVGSQKETAHPKRQQVHLLVKVVREEGAHFGHCEFVSDSRNKLIFLGALTCETVEVYTGSGTLWRGQYAQQQYAQQQMQTTDHEVVGSQAFLVLVTISGIP